MMLVRKVQTMHIFVAKYYPPPPNRLFFRPDCSQKCLAGRRPARKELAGCEAARKQLAGRMPAKKQLAGGGQPEKI